MKRLQLVRKKLLPLLLCVAVAGSQVPVMAADVEGFSDSAEGFNEEWSEDTQTQSSEAEDTTETAEGNTTENTGIPDEQTEDIALQSSEEDTETPETSEGLSSDSQEDTFGDGEESFGDASDSGESGIEYIKGRPLTEEEEQEQLAPFDNPLIPPPWRSEMMWMRYRWEELRPIRPIIMQRIRDMLLP